MKINEGIYYLLLLASFSTSSLKNKLLNIWTIRWYLDTKNNLKLSRNPSNRKLRFKIKKQSKADTFEESRKTIEGKLPNNKKLKRNEENNESNESLSKKTLKLLKYDKLIMSLSEENQ